MTLERAKEIRARIWDSHGWDGGETPDERREITAFWRTLRGTTTYYDAVCELIAHLRKETES